MRRFGTGDQDFPVSVDVAGDGTYIVAGSANTVGAGEHDAVVARIGPGGDTLWSTTIGGNGTELATWAGSSGDGVYVCSRSLSFGATSGEVLVTKLSSSGSHEWSLTIENVDGVDIPHACVPLSDGSLLVTCETRIQGAYYGGVARITSTGVVQWKRSFPGFIPRAVAASPAGTAILAGSGNGGSVAVARISVGGVLDWRRTVNGGTIGANVHAAAVSDDGSVYVAASDSLGAILIRLSAAGDLHWAQRISALRGIMSLAPGPANSVLGLAAPAADQVIAIDISPTGAQPAGQVLTGFTGMADSVSRAGTNGFAFVVGVGANARVAKIGPLGSADLCVPKSTLNVPATAITDTTFQNGPINASSPGVVTSVTPVTQAAGALAPVCPSVSSRMDAGSNWASRTFQSPDLCRPDDATQTSTLGGSSGPPWAEVVHDLWHAGACVPPSLTSRADLGLIKIDPRDATAQTRSSIAMGTPEYMAPSRRRLCAWRIPLRAVGQRTSATPRHGEPRAAAQCGGSRTALTSPT